MKPILLLFISLCITMMLQAQVSKSIEVTAGGLKTALTVEELTNVTNLTLSGIIDARDFKTLRDTLPHLNTLDLTDVNIIAYNGNEGPSGYYNYYQAKTIPAYAFYNPNTDKGKNSMTTVILPSSITAIEYYAFQKCSGLTSVEIPSLVSTIGSAAFQSCSSLISVNIPASVTSIGSNAFSCSGLISVDSANPNYSSLDGVLFDKNRTTLLQCPTSKTGNYSIPSSVSFIGYEAFSNCYSLTSITISSSVTSLNTSSFNNCSGLISVDEGNPNYSSLDGVLFDKGMSRLIKCPVSKTESYLIPEKVATIGEQAFYNCKLLSSITIPASVTSIGNDAFVLCSGLTTIYANSSYPIILGPYTYVFGLVNQTTCILNVPFGAKKFYALADQWKDFTNMVEQLNGFILSSNILKLASDDGSSASVIVTANVAWTASTDQTWLTVNPTSGTGNNALIFTATANTSVAIRTAKVTVSATGFPTQTISVTQSGIIKTIDIEAGALLSGLNTDELSQISRLTITGTMDSRDFKIMRDRMPSLAELDLSGVTIAAYSGADGTYYTSDYPANSIPDYAFYDWYTYPPKSSLISVILPASITSIGNYAFNNCKGLTSIILPPSVTSIGYSAFNHCSGLTSIVAESSYPVDLSSSWSVFQGIDTYKCILNVPYGSKDLYKAAYPWNNFTNIVEDSQGFIISPMLIKVATEGGSGLTANIEANVTWTASSDQTWLTINPGSGTGNNTLTLTAEANTTVVTRIAKVTISAPDITSQSITISQQGIPKTVAVTAGGLFTGLTTAELYGITNLTITGTIDARDFKTMRDNMPMLAVLDLSGTTVVKYSGTEGTSYQMDYPANAVPENAFYNQNTGKAKISLISVVLPSSLSSVGNMSFYGCSAMTLINIPSSVSFIGGNAFNGCSSLTSLVLPPSLASIEFGTLQGCFGLTDISIPSSVTSVGDYAFQGCISLTSIILPSMVLSIGSNAFNYCIGLTSVSIPSSVKSIGDGAFSSCIKLTSVVIPTSITKIENNTFQGCYAMTSVTIPSLVNLIGSQAFGSCNSLSSVNIPSTVTAIGSGAFAYCTSLTSIDLNSSHPVNLAASPEVFSGINKTTCTLNVPYKSKQLYAAADQWKDFTNILEKSEGFLFDSSVLSFSAEGGNILVNTKANVLWTASSDQAWLTVNPNSEVGIRAITFTAEANQTSATRKAKVTVSAPGILSQSITITQEGLPKVIELSAGNLLAGLTAEELSGITNLIITGTIDARDFKTMRDNMPSLSVLDLSGAAIAAYTGTEGTAGWEYNYPANEIPIYAFLNQNTYTRKTSLTSAILPTSVISIGSSAFQGCTGLTSITIPSSVTIISGGAFNSCSGLTSIYADSGIPVDLSNSWSVFDGIDKNICKLYVPYKSKERYVAAWQWQEFTNIVEPTQGFLLSTAKLNLAASAGSNATATITSNVSWTASSDQTWLTINLSSGTDDQTLTFTAEANPYKIVREAQVIFSATGIPSQTITLTQEGYTAPLIVSAGNLKTLLSAEELAAITKLKLTGTIDARDFKTMRDEMPNLTEIDISEITVVEYTGTEGTSEYLSSMIYPANAVPYHAFYYYWSENNILTSVILPQSIISIGEGAFWNCTGLTSILIQPLVSSIERAAFANCSNLKTITLPTSVKTIGRYVFQDCDALKNLEIPSSTSSIENFAFLGCNAQINVDSENPNYSSIDGVLFNKEQTRLIYFPGSKADEYTIPASVTAIEETAFYFLERLTTVTIPSSVKSYGYGAFWACMGLTSIHVNRSMPVDLSNSHDVFNYVDKTNCILYVPYGSKTAYQAADQWKDFVNIVEATEGFNLSTNEVNIASAAGSKATATITSNVDWTASSDQSWLKVNPDSGQDTLEITMTAEENLTFKMRIAKVTFSATGVESQTITVTQEGLPLAVTAGNLKTLYTAEELAAITRLKLTGTIDARDFKTMRDDMPNLAEIDLSEVTIAEYTGIEGTAGENNILYPGNAVPENAVFNIDNQPNVTLISIILPPSVTTIGNRAFLSCNNLTSANIPSSVTTIGNESFAFCHYLTINIPSSVTYIGYLAFEWVLSRINVDENNLTFSSIDGVLFDKTQTTIIKCPISISGDYIIPSTVTSIKSSAFDGCYNLTSIKMPSSLISIGDYAFRSCRIGSITIPSQVNYIGSYALSGCSDLISIIANSSFPVNLYSDPSVFSGVDKSICTLYVPYGSKAAYQAADQWKDFVNIVEGTEGFNLSTNSVTISASVGSMATATITSNIGWTASSDQTWLKVNPDSGQDTLEITMTAEANSSYKIRIAKVTFSANGVDTQTITVTQDGLPLAVTAGKLKAKYTSEELRSITRLKLTGTIDARDFKTMRDDMPMLAEIDLSGVRIVAYSGEGGTSSYFQPEYPANAVPDFAFFDINTYQGKISLQKVILPTSVTSLGELSFGGCSGLISMDIPSSVKTIGISAFMFCSGLLSVQIPSAVTVIRENAFYNSRGSFNVDPKNLNYSSVDGVLFNKSQTLLIQCPTSKEGDYFIPSTVRLINDGAFANCESIISVTIPSSVSSIGWGAFSDCRGLTSIDIPSSVMFIGANSFGGCTGLTSVHSHAVIPVDLSFSSEVFQFVDKSICQLHVPYGTKSLYAAANQWKDFSSIVEKTQGFTISKSSLSLAGEEGSTAILDLKANVVWTVRSDESWLSVNPTSGTGDQTMTFIGKFNQSILSRVAKVTVSSSGGNDQIITVVQDGGIPAVNVLIADYPLRSNGIDATGKNDEMVLINAPFQNNGIFCNGIYYTGQPNSYLVMTPQINDFDPNSFIISIDFWVDEFKNQPVIILGPNCRRVGFYLKEDGTVDLFYNNQYHLGGTESYLLNELHNAKISYDGITAKIFLDNVLAGFIDVELETNCGDYLSAIGSTNLGNGETFKGYLKNLKVYNPMAASCELSATGANMKAKQGSQVKIDITANVAWSVTCDQSWLTVNPTSGTGSKTLTFTAEANTADTERTAIVTVNADGVDPQTITFKQFGIISDVSDLAEILTSLKCYPNPFTDQISIEIQNPKHAEISVDIYNQAGERIKNLAAQRKDEKLDLKWNGTNDSGQKVVSGVYICKMNKQSKQLIYQGNNK